MCRAGAQRKWFSLFVVWFGVHDEALWHMREVRLENRSQIWNACTWFSHILRTQLARQNPKSGSFFFLYRSETFSSVWDDRRGQETTCVWTSIGATSRRRDFTATLAFLKVWDSLPSFLTPRDNTPLPLRQQRLTFQCMFWGFIWRLDLMRSDHCINTWPKKSVSSGWSHLKCESGGLFLTHSAGLTPSEAENSVQYREATTLWREIRYYINSLDNNTTFTDITVCTIGFTILSATLFWKVSK